MEYFFVRIAVRRVKSEEGTSNTLDSIGGHLDCLG